MRLMPFLIMLAVVSVTGSILFAAEPPNPGAQTQPVPKAADKAADKPADKPVAGKSSPQRFVPSEQVRADFDVSFPIDI